MSADAVGNPSPLLLSSGCRRRFRLTIANDRRRSRQGNPKPGDYPFAATAPCSGPPRHYRSLPHDLLAGRLLRRPPHHGTELHYNINQTFPAREPRVRTPVPCFAVKLTVVSCAIICP